MLLLKSIPTTWSLLGVCIGLAAAQFSSRPQQSGQRGFFDSDEFDFDRSRERNSLERDSLEFNRFGRDSDEIFISRPINGRNFNQNSRPGQSANNRFNANNLNVRNNDGFRTATNAGNSRFQNNPFQNNGNFRTSLNNGQSRFRSSEEDHSFEISIPFGRRSQGNNRNNFVNTNNHNLGNRAFGGFSKESNERDSIEVSFVRQSSNINNNRNLNSNNRNNVNNNRNININNNRNNINNNRNRVSQNRAVANPFQNGGFRFDSPEDDSFESRESRFSPFTSNNQNSRLNINNQRTNNAGRIVLEKDSFEDDSLEFKFVPSRNTNFNNGNSNLRTNTKPLNRFQIPGFTQKTNENSGLNSNNQQANIGGKFVLEKDSFEDNSLELKFVPSRNNKFNKANRNVQTINRPVNNFQTAFTPKINQNSRPNNNNQLPSIGGNFVLERDSIEDDSLEFKFLPSRNSNFNNGNGNLRTNAKPLRNFQANSFRRDSDEHDSIEIKLVSPNNPFIRNQNIINNRNKPTAPPARNSLKNFGNQQSNNKINRPSFFGSTNFRIGHSIEDNSIEDNSFEIKLLPPVTNTNFNRKTRLNSFGSTSLRRGSDEHDSIEIKFVRQNNQQNNNQQGNRGGRNEGFRPSTVTRNQQTNNQGNFVLVRDSPEDNSPEDHSLEFRFTPPRDNRLNNVNKGLPVNVPSKIFGNVGFRRDSDERDNSFEVAFSRNNNNRNIQQDNSNALLAAFGIKTDSQNNPGNFKLNVPFPGRNTQSNQQPNIQVNRNRNTGRPSSVNRPNFFDSLERDSPEDLLEDLFDDSLEDRRRAQFALERLAAQKQTRPQSPGNPFTQSNSERTQGTGFRPISNPFVSSVANVGVANRNANSKPVQINQSFNPPKNKNRNTQTSVKNSSNRFPTLPSTSFRNQDKNSRFNSLVIRPNSQFNNNKNSNSLNTFGNHRLNLNNPFLSKSHSDKQQSNNKATFNQNTPGVTTPRPTTHTPRPTSSPSRPRTQPTQRIRPNQTTRRPTTKRPTTKRPTIRRTTTRRPATKRPSPPRQVFTAPPRKTITTTPRPFRPTASARPRPTVRPNTTTRRPTTQRSKSQSHSSLRNGNRNNKSVNPFVTTAKLNNGSKSSPKSQFTTNTFFPGVKQQPRKTTKTPTKKASFSNTKKSSKLRKSIPVRVPEGFNWPGGNGYYFRMSTGNSKPVQYFISYDK